jgi:hypothetical protein
MVREEETEMRVGPLNPEEFDRLRKVYRVQKSLADDQLRLISLDGESTIDVSRYEIEAA